MHSVWMGEFAGTLVLVLLGTGINAGVTLRKSYAADSGWIAITTGWALAVLCGVLVALFSLEQIVNGLRNGFSARAHAARLPESVI